MRPNQTNPNAQQATPAISKVASIRQSMTFYQYIYHSLNSFTINPDIPFNRLALLEPALTYHWSAAE